MCPSSGFPDDFDPTSSILFLGSGFSADATNVSGNNPPTGKGLEQKLLKVLHLPEGSDYDLKDLATHASKIGIDIYALLTNEYTIKLLTNDQCIILFQKWRRIYTTNYDDSTEYYYKTANAKCKSSPSIIFLRGSNSHKNSIGHDRAFAWLYPSLHEEERPQPIGLDPLFVRGTDCKKFPLVAAIRKGFTLR